jgi:elongation factor 1-gamma
MEKATLRIFSYLPNPRVWKAQIAGELCGVRIDVVGDSPRNLAGWLWDFDWCSLVRLRSTCWRSVR